MGNPNGQRQPTGPCSTCNANGGQWHGEPGSVHCLRSGDSGRHVTRGDQAAIWSNGCWQPVGVGLPLTAVMELIRPALRK